MVEFDFSTLQGRLRFSRARNKVSQETMANIIGVSQKTYNNYESEKTPVPHDKAIKLLEALNSSFDFIFLGKDTKESRNEAMLNIRQNTQLDTKIENGCLVTTTTVPLFKHVG